MMDYYILLLCREVERERGEGEAAARRSLEEISEESFWKCVCECGVGF